MIFKGFKFGKSKDKGKLPAGDATATQIAELEEQLNDQTDNLKQTEKKLKRLSGKVSTLAEIEVTPVQPHGPIEELSIESEDTLEGIDEEENTGAALEEGVEDVKLVEVSAESEPSPSAEKKRKNDLDGDSLKALFTSEEEEENPLANLIHSLPDVTIDELTEDLKEIKDIIKDWQKK
jgi:TolA-binding protein